MACAPLSIDSGRGRRRSMRGWHSLGGVSGSVPDSLVPSGGTPAAHQPPVKPASSARKKRASPPQRAKSARWGPRSGCFRWHTFIFLACGHTVAARRASSAFLPTSLIAPPRGLAAGWWATVATAGTTNRERSRRREPGDEGGRVPRERATLAQRTRQDSRQSGTLARNPARPPGRRGRRPAGPRPGARPHRPHTNPAPGARIHEYRS
jgi:hypothetical protein